jgi:hypothetical protein
MKWNSRPCFVTVSGLLLSTVAGCGRAQIASQPASQTRKTTVVLTVPADANAAAPDSMNKGNEIPQTEPDTFPRNEKMPDEEMPDGEPDEEVQEPESPPVTVPETTAVLVEGPIVTIIPEFKVGNSNWRQTYTDTRLDKGPYIVQLERESETGTWVPVTVTSPPTAGGIQTSIPVVLDNVLYTFVSYDDGVNAEISVLKSTDDGATWQPHGSVETGNADGWPNGINQHAIVCNDWLVNIDSEGSMISHDHGVTWSSNGGYFTGLETALACSDPLASKTALPTSSGTGKQ